MMTTSADIPGGDEKLYEQKNGRKLVYTIEISREFVKASRIGKNNAGKIIAAS